MCVAFYVVVFVCVLLLCMCVCVCVAFVCWIGPHVLLLLLVLKVNIKKKKLNQLEMLQPKERHGELLKTLSERIQKTTRAIYCMIPFM